MGTLQGDVIYNKFLTEKIEMKISSIIIEMVLMKCEMFLKYQNQELQHTINPCLKSDIKMMIKIIEDLRNIKGIDNKESSILLTISEFLLFKYGIRSVARLVSLESSDSLGIGYTDFLIYLEKTFRSLNENEVKVYYEFLAAYDKPQTIMMN
jgi:hypothetical protein